MVLGEIGQHYIGAASYKQSTVSQRGSVMTSITNYSTPLVSFQHCFPLVYLKIGNSGQYKIHC